MFDNLMAFSIVFISFYTNHSALIPSINHKLLRTAPYNMCYVIIFLLLLLLILLSLLLLLLLFLLLLFKRLPEVPINAE